MPAPDAHAADRTIAHRRAAIWLVVAGILTYAAAAIAVRTGPPAWDASLFLAINDTGGGWGRILHALSRLALPVGLTIVAVGTAAFVVAWNRSVVPLVSAAAAGVMAWFVSSAAKLIVDRPRPYETLADAVLRQQPAHGTSFPSSHTATTVAVVIALLPFLPRPARIVAVGFAVLVGWSRIYLGVHYPLDVIAGAGVGLAVGGTVWLAKDAMSRRLRRRREPRADPP